MPLGSFWDIHLLMNRFDAGRRSLQTESAPPRSRRTAATRPAPATVLLPRSEALQRRSDEAGRALPVRTWFSAPRRPRPRLSSPRPLLLVAFAVVAASLWWWLSPSPAPPATGSTQDLGANARGNTGGVARAATSVDPGAGGAATGRAAMAPVVVDQALQEAVQRLSDRVNGTSAAVIRNLGTGATASVHAQEVFPSASLAKLPILVEVYRRLDAGTLLPTDRVEITSEAITGGAGVLQARAGEEISVAELLRLSVTVSDNVAARLLMQRVGGVTAVSQTMAAMGLAYTRLYADDRPNTTTAQEMSDLLTFLAVKDGFAGGRAPVVPVVPSAVSRGESSTAIPPTLLSLLSLTQAQSWLTGGVPRDIVVAHKSGQLPSLRHDAGVIFGRRGTYVVVGLTNDLADQDAAEGFLADLARTAYTHFG